MIPASPLAARSIAAALCSILIAASGGEAGRLIQEIDQAKEDYDLPKYLESAGRFLDTYPAHADADRVRYELALQMITESIRDPNSKLAEKGRTLLRSQIESSRDRDRRFDAALLLLKFSRDSAEEETWSKLLRSKFEDHGSFDQVYYFLIHRALVEKRLDLAASYARSLLARYPKALERERYERIIRRADRLGKPLPLAVEQQRALGNALAGKVVLVDFWASWCAPCLEELPRLRRFYSEHQAQGLEILSVSLDSATTASPSNSPVDRTKPPFPWRALAPGPLSSALADALGVDGLPSYVLVDRRGKVVDTEISGAAMYKKLEAMLVLAP